MERYFQDNILDCEERFDAIYKEGKKRLERCILLQKSMKMSNFVRR